MESTKLICRNNYRTFVNDNFKFAKRIRKKNRHFFNEMYEKDYFFYANEIRISFN